MAGEREVRSTEVFGLLARFVHRTSQDAATLLAREDLVGASRSRPGAPATSRVYAGTLLWALGGIVTGQRRRSPSAAACAAVSAAAVLWSVVRTGPRP